MTHAQMLAFGLLAATVAAFVWGRLRYDLVALGSLLAGVLIGVVPAKTAFDGFKSDVVAIIATALVVSGAFARSGVIEALTRPLLARVTRERALVPLLTAATALLSMTTKNVGALAILMPVAQQAARRTETSVSRLLMPMSFASLLGGLVTLVGTSPNIIVSEVRAQTLGKPFGMYDFAPVGLCLTAIGLAFLSLAYRVLPRERESQTPLSEVLAANAYVTEAEAPEGWQSRRIGALTAKHPEVTVTALVRGAKRRSAPHPNSMVKAGDVLLLEGEQEALHQFLTEKKLRLHRAAHPLERTPRQEVRSVEAIIGPDSVLIGRNAGRLNLQSDFGVKLVAVARAGRHMVQRLGSATLRAGDMMVLRGAEAALPAAMTQLGALPLAEREVRLGGPRRG